MKIGEKEGDNEREREKKNKWANKTLWEVFLLLIKDDGFVLVITNSMNLQ